MESEKILLLTRTTKFEDVKKKTDGLTLFLTDLDRSTVEIRPIHKMGRNAVSSNELFIDDLVIPQEDRIGDEGEGFRYILDGLNPERMLVAAEALGLGRAALRRAVRYGNERVVFGRPIGMNQGLQFPLADSLAHLDAAELVLRKATWLYDNGKPCGREANTAKYLCAEAGFNAADRALQVHGGMGYLRSTTWRDTSAKPGCCASPRSARRWCSTTWARRCSDCRGATDVRLARPLRHLYGTSSNNLEPAHRRTDHDRHHRLG
jgi:acyl-CoA dehydrogenase